jgi:hypothetical protein
MSLADEIAHRRARSEGARSPDPELEAKLDRFIAENPRLRERYQAMSKNELLRRVMAERMESQESANLRNREIEPWVKEHPEIVEKVAQRVKTEATEKLRHIEQVKRVIGEARNHGLRLRM